MLLKHLVILYNEKATKIYSGSVTSKTVTLIEDQAIGICSNVLISLQLTGASNLILMVYGSDKPHYNFISGSSSSVSGLTNTTVSRSGKNVTFSSTSAFVLTVLV